MKLALVTTPWDARSRVGDRVRGLVRHLADHCQIDVYVEAGREGGEYSGWTTRSASKLSPRDYDQVLYPVGNESEHGFMAPMVRALGGCVALHDWVLFDLALAAWPALGRGGWRGAWLALREGGPTQARRYVETRRNGAAPSDSGGRLTFNRSIVRFADTFVVPSRELECAILADRNAPTPIGVVDPESEPEALAASYVELLDRLPPPRTARKSLIWRRVVAELRAR